MCTHLCIGNIYVCIPSGLLNSNYRNRTQGSGVKMRKSKIGRYNLCYLISKKTFSNLPNITWWLQLWLWSQTR